MEEATLQQTEGVTYNLFNEQVTNATDPTIDEKDGNPKHIIVDEVVRNNKMHYFKVPRLGSYLAIKMEYQSTLFEEAYDTACENYVKVFNLNKQQEKDKKDFEEEQYRL